MGLFGDNFYSWLYGGDKNDRIEKQVQDAQPNGYKHPDGSPCRAKSIETCPFYKKEEHELVNTDVLDPVAQVQLKSTPHEYNGIKKGENPETKNVRPVSHTEIKTLKPGSTKSKYREMRNVAYAELLKKKSQGKEIDGTYPLDNPTEKVQHKGSDGKMQDGFEDGWQVSFQTTNGEGFNSESKDFNLMLSDNEYDSIVEKLSKETGSKPYLGVFGAIPEISFRCNTRKQAMEIARRYNQVSIANNKRIARGKFDRLTFPNNGEYDWRKNQIFVMK